MHTIKRIKDGKAFAVSQFGEDYIGGTVAKFETYQFAYIFCSWLNGGDHPNLQLINTHPPDITSTPDALKELQERFWGEHNRLNITNN